MTVPWTPLAYLRERLRDEVRDACQEWQLDPEQLSDEEVDRLICVIASMPDEAEDVEADHREGLRRYEQLCGKEAA